MPGTLYIGDYGRCFNGVQEDLTGHRFFNAFYPPLPAKQLTPTKVKRCTKIQFSYDKPYEIIAGIDSGAFNRDLRNQIFSFADSLEHQFLFEKEFNQACGVTNWMAESFVVRDVLIDEKWTNGQRSKERWDVADAEWAVAETIAAAQYFDSNRSLIEPRQLIMSCQGVDAEQYERCAIEVLKYVQPQDVVGLGGWCILGQQQFAKWRTVFYETLCRVIPLIAKSGVKRVHLFGVLFYPCLAKFAYICDRYGLHWSTDSGSPIKKCQGKTPEARKKAGAYHPDWRENVRIHKSMIATIHQRYDYVHPPKMDNQLSLFMNAA